MNEIEEEILEKIKDLLVECPECESIEDDEYTCTTCWSNGQINVFKYLKENKGLLK